MDRQLATHGIDTVLIDPGTGLLNPLAARGTVLAALDPLRALRVVVSHRRADIVVSVFESAALPLSLLRSITRFRVPVVLWDLGLGGAWRLREHILDWVVPRVQGIFVLSASQKDHIETHWGRRHGVEILGHSIDTEFFRPTEFPSPASILAVGEDIGRDFATLLAAAPGIDASIILKTRRVPAGEALPRNVTVVRERVSHSELRNLYAASRIVVAPLLQTLNASGVSTILEAGAMGRALVVSDNPAIRDFITPGETCLLVPPGDSVALQAAVTRLLREPETCFQLGRNARRFVEQHCALPAFADRFAKLLWRYSRHGNGGGQSG
ncbi:MAG TPA: glycosyltransferase family 4 protein [Acetobacteraceae bacterium]|nr:glycosyltransferase family 4 protein [Acetobacteraceae bacterium]